MSKSRAPLAIGGAVVAGIGYYVYTSGGDTKVAKSKFEHDTEKTKANAEATYNSLKDSASSAAEAAKKQAQDAQNKLEKEYNQTKTATMKKIDEADRKVEEKAAAAKSWFSK